MAKGLNEKNAPASDRQDKRMRIIAAALNVFSRKGYHTAKVEEIAEMAGVGKGTVYEYFPSKLNLFQETYMTVMHRYAGRLMDDTGGFESVRDRIRHMLELHLKFIMENRDLTLVTFYDLNGLDEEILDWMHEMRRIKIEQMKGIYLEGIQRGELRQTDPELAANIMAGIMQGMVGPILVENYVCDPGEWALQATDILFSGLGEKGIMSRG